MCAAKPKKTATSETVLSDKVFYFDDQKRNEFTDILKILASDQTILAKGQKYKEIVIRLESLYADANYKYHHYYADIYSQLTFIANDSQSNLDVLAQNLTVLKDSYKPEGGKDISKEICKLYDHVNLEIARFNYSLTIKNESQSELAKLTTSLEDANKKYAELEEKTKTVKEEMQHEKIDNVAILGIFASIVLAFVGSLTFSTSVLKYIKDVNIYRLIFVTSLICLLFFNTIWLLTEFISKIINKSFPITKVVGFFMNIILIVIIGLDIIAFSNDWFSIQQKEIKDEKVQATVISRPAEENIPETTEDISKQ